MKLTKETVCMELLLDLVSYEKHSGRLSPEAKYLFERHLEQCPDCRHKVLALRRMLHGAALVPNFG